MTTGRPGWRRAASLVTIAMWIAATACGSPAVSPAVSAAPSASAPPAEVCRPIDLLTPTGERVDLTGTWQVIGGEPFYFVHQDGDCIWIAGVFLSVEGERFNPILRGQTFGFDGHLLPDFTLQGRWVILDLPSRTRLSATGSWALDVEVDPWTLRGPPRDTPTGPVSLLLERVSDGFVSP